MGDLKLQGSQGMWGKEAPIHHREVNQGVTPAQVINATQDNNLDEMIVVDQQAKMHVVYADELSVKNGSLPKEGTKVHLPFIEGEATVLHVDNESNEDYSGLTAGLVGLWMNKNGGMSGDDSAIRKLTHESGPVQAEKSKTAHGQGDFKWEVPKDFKPFSPDKIKSETEWALDLENKVKSGHQPNDAETKRYKDVYFALIVKQNE